MLYQQVHPLIRQEIEEHSFCKLCWLINFKYALYLYNYQDLRFLVIEKNILSIIKGVQIVLVYAKTLVFQNYTGNVIVYSK